MNDITTEIIELLDHKFFFKQEKDSYVNKGNT